VSDVARLLEEVRSFVRRYVVLTDAQAVAITLWVFHTHAIDASETTPYLSVTSAEKRSGKTRLLEVLQLLVREPLLAANVTPAALFRSLGDEVPPTVLHDEIDAIFGPKANGDEDLRSLFNAGYRRGAPVLRCVGDGSKQKVVPFEVYCAKALAGIGRLPDTIADRSIPIRLKRRSRSEKVERFHRREAADAAEPIYQALVSLAGLHVDQLADARPELPDQLDDRAQDAFEQLVAIADLAGGEWPAGARAALVALRAQGDDDEATAGERILADCRTVFDERGVDRLPTSDLLEALYADKEAPWADWRGRGLTAHSLAGLLHVYGIKSRTIRQPGGDTAKGYMRASFEDAWTRYTPVSANQNVTPSQASSHAGLTRDVLDSAETETSRLNAFTDAGCDGVTDENPENPEIDLGTATLDQLREHFADHDDGEVDRLAGRYREFKREDESAVPSSDEEAVLREAAELVEQGVLIPLDRENEA
jgi:hypothetical protein